MAGGVRVALRPGRLLRRSPVWPCAEARVVFDAASGDHWVLSLTGDAILGAVETCGAMPLSGLADRLAGIVESGSLSMIVDELIRGGLLTEAGAPPAAAPVPPPSHA